MARLYLLPLPIADDAPHTVPAYVIDIMRSVKVFVMERGKTGRRFLKACAPDIVLSEKIFIEMEEAPYGHARQEMMRHLIQGHDVAITSESGCPGVADPGQLFVQDAQDAGIQVVPLVGPSSILLALMASGLSGQQFAFVGYVTNQKDALPIALKKLEERSRQLQQTQIFIETPYRNQNMLEALVSGLQPTTHMCLAYDLTGKDELVISQSIRQWRKSARPKLAKKPAIFLLFA